MIPARNVDRLGEVCRVLCAMAGHPEFWDGLRPQEGAVDVLHGRSYLSSGELVLVLTAWAVWNCGGSVRIAALASLDQPGRIAIGKLLACATADETEAWITAQRKELL